VLRTSLAVAAGKAARVVSRLRGGGSALPGLVAERVDPAFLTHALADLPHGIVVITGTNGKTTTTKMLVAILRQHGRKVFTNPTGSNFTRGVISSMLGELKLSGRLEAEMAVLELDEAHALKFAATVRPTHSLLLNVARDQLDRFAEIDQTAKLLAELAAQTTTGVVLNIDDSFVSRIAGRLAGSEVEVRYFGVDPSIADRLPELREADVRFEDDFAPPAPTANDGLLKPKDDRTFEVCFSAATGDLDGDGAGAGADNVGPLELKQRGLAAMINATAATTTAKLLLGNDFRADRAVAALEEVTPPFGRGEVIDADGQPLELVLVKNPVGFTVALGTYGSTPVTSMIAINDNYADGRDVSWLYDVSFESLRDKGVALTSGVRAYDMALRLQYDDVAVAEIEPDLDVALKRFLTAYTDEPKRIFCTYTAMMALRRDLAARYGLANFGEEAQS
jgi:UDP-N-acetylmuramyl tripeptide synthase